MKSAFAIALKDLRGDGRSKETLPAMILFALTLVFLFSFALPPGAGRAPIPEPKAGAVGAREISGTFLWIGLLFAGIVGFGKTASIERDGSLLDALALAPADPAAIFFGKAMGNFAFLTALELAVIPFFIVFIDVRPDLLLPELLAVMVVANVGLSAIGTLFGTASQFARARALILPLLSFPVMLPVILSASRLTSSLMTTGTFSTEGRWFILMAAFDVAFIALGAVTFEFVIRE